jgi:hypothetical protein
MRVLELRDDADLAQEPLGAERVGEFRPQQLDRNMPVMLDIARQVHRGHATHTELPFDVIAATKDGSEVLESIQRIGRLTGDRRWGATSSNLKISESVRQYFVHP